MATNRFTQVLDQLRAEGVTLLDLTVSNPTQCGLAYNQQAILSAFQNSQSLTYDPQPKGLLIARQAVTRYYGQDHQTEIDQESVFDHQHQ